MSAKVQEATKYSDGNYSEGYSYLDEESGSTGSLGMKEYGIEAQMRNGFIRKVYGILAFQLMLTCLFSTIAVYSAGVNSFITTNVWLFYFAMFSSIALLIALFFCKDKYPINFILLTAWTFVEAYTVAIICALYANAGEGKLVVEALVLTGSVFIGLSTYAWYATKRGVDFSWMGAGLGAALWVLIFWGFFSMIFGFGGGSFYCLFGVLIFCGYVVYDTHMIMTRLGYDDYILGAIMLYLDIINLFLFILEALSKRN